MSISEEGEGSRNIKKIIPIEIESQTESEDEEDDDIIYIPQQEKTIKGKGKGKQTVETEKEDEKIEQFELSIFSDNEDAGDQIDSENEQSDEQSKVQQKKEKEKRKTVTIREFVVYRFMIRDSNRTKSILHHAGRLFQQYIVD